MRAAFDMLDMLSFALLRVFLGVICHTVCPSWPIARLSLLLCLLLDLLLFMMFHRRFQFLCLAPVCDGLDLLQALALLVPHGLSLTGPAEGLVQSGQLGPLSSIQQQFLVVESDGDPARIWPRASDPLVVQSLIEYSEFAYERARGQTLIELGHCQVKTRTHKDAAFVLTADNLPTPICRRRSGRVVIERGGQWFGVRLTLRVLLEFHSP
mmetsp:Transcript_43641/g.125986  ORF Transcript_43641/g.125986 Transcript_43641/m.125986 type:complete len:210 (-) Transcript_43641:765-1394(-)